MRLSLLSRTLCGIVRRSTRHASSISLRPYQMDCIQSCLSAIGDGKNRIAVSLATGGGKTVIFSHLTDQVVPQGVRDQTLIVVHRRELVEQAANHCREACPNSTIDVEMSHHHASGAADITVCSLQSLVRRLDKYDKDRIKLIIIDEAHHAAAKTYIEILENFDATSADSKVVVVGFSATLFRRDGLQLASVFDHIVFHKDYLSMMRDGYLCSAKLTTVTMDNISLKGIKLTGPDGDFAISQLAERVNTTAANNASVGAWMDRAKDRKSTIVFAVDIQHVMDLANCFREHGVDARAVTSRNTKVERTELIRAFRNGDFPVLVNCGILTEGFDSPQIDCVLLSRPTKSVGLLVQMIGRGLRLAQGKNDCHILDMTSCLDVGVASIPSLFGLSSSELADRETTFEQLAQKAIEASDVPKEEEVASLEPVQSPPMAVSYVDYDDIQDLMSDHEIRGDRHISRLSPLNWLQTDVDKYILALGSKGFIKIVRDEESDEESWTGTYTMKLPPGTAAILARPKVLFERVISLERAVAAGDTKALNLGQRVVLLRNAPWRKTEASPAQKAFMMKLGSKGARNRPITRGEAHDFITRFTHGGKGFVNKVNKENKAKQKLELRQFKEQETRAARASRENEKLMKRDRVYNPEIQVGPLLS